jgi:AcrR family transcriptional regulator
MKMEPKPGAPRRPYRQTARAAAAEATGARLVEAFRQRLERQWFEDIRLEDVAQDAGVTVQTVIRRFGGKDGLMSATVDLIAATVKVTRETPPGDVPRAVRAIIEDYENQGDLMMRLLDQEGRHPMVRRFADRGRAEHRAWVAEVFVGALSSLPPAHAQRRLDALVVATDLYVWKLIRRDMRRPVPELQALMERLVQAALSV